MILDGAALKALEELAAELEARADDVERQGQIEK
jgi:hypothetical protein